jgi:CubicO group peptidase (beta-lactamase class C family)
LALMPALLGSGVRAADPPPTTTVWVVTPEEGARLARVEATLPALDSGGHTRRMDIAAWMSLYDAPGVSVAVWDDFKLVWAKAYGVKAAGGRDPVTLDTLFQAGSISKPVSAIAAMQQVERGRLSLDADIDTVLRSWKVPQNELTAKEKVTLRRLLSHRAGLTVHGFRSCRFSTAPGPRTPRRSASTCCRAPGSAIAEAGPRSCSSRCRMCSGDHSPTS